MARARLAKLSRPRLHDAVARTRLFGSLDARRSHPIIWIAGPPGSGKTTLTASYVDACASPATWYLLDKGDSDPATFFFYLSQAVPAPSRSADRPLPLLTEEYLADLEGFARRFMRGLFLRLPSGALLVLDNYHELASDSPLHAMLNAGFAEVPDDANVLIVSRAEPPAVFARARVSGSITVLDWDELRLQPDETAAIAAHRHTLDEESIAAIHQRAGGWVAGVRLLLETALNAASPASQPIAGQIESTFDYFTAEIFDASPAELRQFLLSTAYLPRFTAAMAQAISGDPQARRRLEDLYRRRLFLDQRPGREVTYQYHDLFRAFLRSRARDCLEEGALAALIARSAHLLMEAGSPEEAFALFVESGDWQGAERIFLEQANALIVRGRRQTLEDWAAALPQTRLAANPWLRYWLGRARALVDAAGALAVLAQAFDAFEAMQDNTGMLLCAAAAVEALHFVVTGWELMRVWLARLKQTLAAQRAPLTADDELRIHAALFWAAENSDACDPCVATSVRKAIELLPLSTDINLRITVANILHYHADRTLDLDAARTATREAHKVLGSAELSADRHALYDLAEAFSSMRLRRFDQSLAALDRADEVIRSHELRGRGYIASVWRAYTFIAAGKVESAQRAMAAALQSGEEGLSVIRQVEETVRSLIEFAGGRMDNALEHNARSLHLCETSGPYTGVCIVVPSRAYMLLACGHLDAARMQLDRIRAETALVEFEHIAGAIALLDAWLALQSGSAALCREALRRCLQAAHDERERLQIAAYPVAMQAVLPVALEQRIEPDVARGLIRDFAVAAPAGAPECWPWAIRIYTLGRFEILMNDTPLTFGRKAPRRTIALLKALIAFGGSAVGEQRIADALWPDLEGDAALESLAAALHRLRRLLGTNDAIRQSGGTLSLDETLCFVDARAFETMMELPGRQSAALDLYRGNFLEGEPDAPWSVSLRERLRTRFVRAVEAVGGDFEAAGEHELAAALYRRGIDTDELVETFYRGLMRCLVALGRPAEAAAAFRRLRQTLSVTLGAAPAPETRKLFESLPLA